jgi:hypothetical protein
MDSLATAQAGESGASLFLHATREGVMQSAWMGIDSSVVLDSLKSLLMLIALLATRTLAVRWITRNRNRASPFNYRRRARSISCSDFLPRTVDDPASSRPSCVAISSIRPIGTRPNLENEEGFPSVCCRRKSLWLRPCVGSTPYFGKAVGALTCCQPSPLSDFSSATRSCCSCSVSSSGIIVLSRCGFLIPPWL